ncbi:TonB-dependent receptor [Comamonas serinivorans]|uniref:TonB-dependent receptor n=1 Tax=Comamonas serinivorans TaxID=1082851 RepID=A0A1Y0EJ77_9BURK|nr:TonB-dependent receptor [Comamonas serinivorans]ARU03419.1 TonB-dependent receptor [Comamonas serinivorans]
MLRIPQWVGPVSCWVLALVSLPALAADESVALPGVTVKGQALEGANQPFSVSTLQAEDVREQGVQEVEALWTKVPGMHVSNYQINGVANSVVLRGFSGGGHGGDIAATLDGIPLNEAMSHADGYFDLNVVVPLELEQAAVHRGPTSVLQGNYNRAGLVELRTRRSGSYKDLSFTAGSHGLVDGQFALGQTLASGDQINLAAQHVRGDGARPDDDFSRSTLSGYWNHRINSRFDIALSGRWHEAKGDSPGYLTEAQWRVDPQGQDPHVVDDGSRKHFKTLRLDAHHDLGGDTHLLGFAYGTRQDFTRWFTRPRGGGWMQREESYDRSVFGLGTNLSGKATLAGGALDWMLGAERVRESTDYGYWDGLVARQHTAPALNDRRTRLTNTAAYGQTSWQATDWLQATAGLRWDHFSGQCRLLGPEAGDDPCERMQNKRHLSPKLGVLAQVNPALAVRANWSEGFALPSDFAKYALGARDLEANVFRQTELGLRWKPSAQWLVDAALYRITSSQEIRNTAPGEYENFGNTVRKGAELQLHWTPHRDWHVAWAYGRARSRVTQSADPALVGHPVSGVPSFTSTWHARWRATPELTVQAMLRHVGRSPLNADNTQWAGSTHWADLGLQYRLPARMGASDMSLSLWVRNVGNTRYASTTTLIGGQRLVAPGMPRTLQLGLQVSL